MAFKVAPVKAMRSARHTSRGSRIYPPLHCPLLYRSHPRAKELWSRLH